MSIFRKKASIKKKKESPQIILLRGACPALEQAINAKLVQKPDFFANYNSCGGAINHAISIYTDWNGLTFLALKKQADINNFTKDDILVYFSAGIARPQNTVVDSVSIISFCDNMNTVLEAASIITSRLHSVYGINYIGFSANEKETTHRLFHLVCNSSELSAKFFYDWIGREVGYLTQGIVNQRGEVVNKYIFELRHRESFLENKGGLNVF